MRQFGLIGFPLEHSFSKKFFNEKFEREGVSDAKYELFPLESIELFPNLIQSNPQLKGLNITIPYKKKIIPYLDGLDPAAKEIGAVNTISLEDGKWIGYNTDAWGFAKSLFPEVSKDINSALILGTGGASKAVQHVLKKLDIPFKIAGRKNEPGTISYNDLNSDLISTHHLIINTTPVGMFPNLNDKINLPLESVTPQHFFMDLVYNPEKTIFLKEAEEKGARIKNGIQMLHEQAEESWKIWNK